MQRTIHKFVSVVCRPFRRLILKMILSTFLNIEPQDQGQRILAVLLHVGQVQLVLQVQQVIQFVGVRLVWFPTQILSLDASQSVFAIQTANMDMFVKTKDVLKNQIHAIHLPVDQVPRVRQIASEILFAGKWYDKPLKYHINFYTAFIS